LPQIESLDLKARYHSPRCGGDFFDVVATDARVLFLLTDIAGERPETHALAVDIQKVFRTRAHDLFKHSDTNESEGIAILARDLNRSLIEAAGGVRFAPAFLGCYNLTLNILTYLYAGDLLAVFHDGEKALVLEPGGIPMGLFTHTTYEPAVLAFALEAKLLLVTKGISESRRGPSIFRDERIPILLKDATADSASGICDAVLQTAYDSGTHPYDLTAVALVRRSGTPGSA
jgi:serine phosphatase RsbU (regulator of sigma subunit)